MKAEGGELRNPWLSETSERRWNKNIGEAEEVEKGTIPGDITEGWPRPSDGSDEGKEGGRSGSVIPGLGDQLARSALAVVES